MMAEYKGGKDTEESRKQITCTLCNKFYDHPKMLTCSHFYCRECINQLALKVGEGKPIQCPDCLKGTVLPEGNVDKLPTALFVNHMTTASSQLEMSRICEFCEDDDAKFFCQQCTQSFCEQCRRFHQKAKKFVDHTVQLIDAIDGDVIKACKTHVSEKLNYYCSSCNCSVCHVCTVNEHKGHNCKLLSVVAPEVKRSVVAKMEPLKVLQANIAQAIEDIVMTINDVDNQADYIFDHIEASFGELEKIIKNRKEDLTKEATRKVVKKRNHLLAQQEDLSASHKSIDTVLNLTELYMKHSTDDDIMTLCSEIKRRLTNALDEEQKDKSLEPVEEADIGVEISCADKVKELCESNAKITHHVITCTVTGKGLEHTEINNMTEFQASIKFPASSRKKKKTFNVKCELKTIKSGSTMPCDVAQISTSDCYTSDYSIQCVPKVQGRHELVLSIDGQEAVGSPFSVFVSVHRTKLGKLVGRDIARYNNRSYNNSISNPMCIAVDASKNEIYLADCGIKVLDLNEKTLRSCFGSYFGIAIDSASDSIFATSGDRLLRFSLDLKIIRNDSVEPGSSFQGITVVGDELFVCDYNSCIKVYTKEFMLLRKISSYGTDPQQVKGLRDISSDGWDNIYVTDESTAGVHVFSRDGAFLRSFSESRTMSDHKLYGIHVTGDLVYVTGGIVQYNNHHVIVYTLEGEYVATFGNFSDILYGVCVDQDGFVYVTKSNNSSQRHNNGTLSVFSYSTPNVFVPFF